MFEEYFSLDEDPQIAMYEETIETLRSSLNTSRGDMEACANIKREILKTRKHIRKLKKIKGV